MELIDVKGLMQRVNLNYNNNQMISVSALKDIINTQPKISLEDIKVDIENRSYGIVNDSVIQGDIYERIKVLEIIDKYIKECCNESNN